jgi:hypothetical protein
MMSENNFRLTTKLRTLCNLLPLLNEKAAVWIFQIHFDVVEF